MKGIYILFGGYLLVIAGLFFYSYTQVDLSLTLSRASLFQTIEKSFQYIGYFQRPFSTYLYCTILGLLFIFYGLFLRKSKKISIKHFWIGLFIVTAILTFSYNAFSYDFFNYIFYTKIILHYHQNPYMVTALDFAHDPMLSFMHWTHNTYPYGPIWLLLTVPLAVLGLGYFLPTFFIFKFFAALCFIVTVYFIGKILKKIAPEYQMFGMLLYASNPLVLIESLVSAHNDGTMICLAIIGMYFLIEKKWIQGFLFIALSVLTKQATIFVGISSLLYGVSLILKKKFISQNMFLLLTSVFTVVGTFITITKIEVQPWYALWFFPFIILIRPHKLLLWFVNGICLGLLLRYVPFLWQGDWNGAASTIKLYVSIVTPFVFLAIGSIYTTFYAKK